MKRIQLFIIALAAITLMLPTVAWSQHQNRTPPQPVRPEFVDSLRTALNSSSMPRLNAFITWLDSLSRADGNLTEARARDLAQKRHDFYTDTKRQTIDTRGWPIVGDPQAPVTITVYYMSTCPACKSSFLEMHTVVTTGALRGKARIVAKPFGAGIGERALVAAHEMGRFADFKLALSRASGRIDENLIYNIADGLYFDRSRFRSIVESPATAHRAEQSIAEARSLGLEFVPSYYINGYRYDSVNQSRWIIDAVDYIIEQR